MIRFVEHGDLDVAEVAVILPDDDRRPAPGDVHQARSASMVFYRHYRGSLTHCQPRVSWYAARTRKASAASESSATTRTNWR